MGGCRCSYKSCRSATKTTENLHFFHYPVKHRERCAIWIRNADKPEFANLPDYQLRNKVICGLHFEDKYFANVEKRRLVHNAIPNLDAGCDSTSDDLSYIKELEILPISNDGSTFTLSLDDLQPGNSAKKQKLDYIAGQSIDLPDVTKVEPEVYTIDPSYFSQAFYNNDSIKDVIISATEKNSMRGEEDAGDDEEDCMIYDTPHAQEKKYVSNENKLQTLFYDHEHEVEQELQETKSSVMTDLSQSTTSGKVMLKSANGTTTTIKKITLANAVTSSSPGGVKRTVFKRVIPAGQVQTLTMPSLSTSSTSAAAVVAQSVLAGGKKQAQQIATNTIRLTNKNLLRCLQGRLPDSLLGAVSLHLNKRRNTVTVEEQDYETMIKQMPMIGRATLRNFGWCIPTPST